MLCFVCHEKNLRLSDYITVLLYRDTTKVVLGSSDMSTEKENEKAVVALLTTPSQCLNTSATAVKIISV